MIQLNFDNKNQFSVNEKQLEECVQRVLAQYDLDHVQLDLSLVNDEQIAPINEQYLAHRGSTDVLSFPTYDSLDQIKKAPSTKENPPNIGQIIVNYQEAKRQAKDSSKTVADKLCFYIEHGLMHLLGYHHD